MLWRARGPILFKRNVVSPVPGESLLKAFLINRLHQLAFFGRFFLIGTVIGLIGTRISVHYEDVGVATTRSEVSCPLIPIRLTRVNEIEAALWNIPNLPPLRSRRCSTANKKLENKEEEKKGPPRF